MNNTDMETFWAVLEHGTLTAAAEALFITQPTLTNRIQALEAEVGAQLFRRGKGIRHIELTEAGSDPASPVRPCAMTPRSRCWGPAPWGRSHRHRGCPASRPPWSPRCTEG